MTRDRFSRTRSQAWNNPRKSFPTMYNPSPRVFRHLLSNANNQICPLISPYDKNHENMHTYHTGSKSCQDHNPNEATLRPASRTGKTRSRPLTRKPKTVLSTGDRRDIQNKSRPMSLDMSGRRSEPIMRREIYVPESRMVSSSGTGAASGLFSSMG